MIGFSGIYKVIYWLVGVLLALALVAKTGAAVFSQEQAGTAGAQFLKIGDGARAVAMGEAYTGVADDISAVSWNLAGLARLPGVGFSYSHAFEMETMNYDCMGFAQPLAGWVVAGNLAFLSMLPIGKFGVDGENQGNFQAYDMALQLSGAVNLKTVLLGVGLKFINQALDGVMASGYAVDLGGLFILPDEAWTLGVTIQNIGPVLKFVQDSTPLPLTIRTGAGYHIRPNWLASADVVMPIDEHPSLHLGTEYVYSVAPGMEVAGRLGFKSNTLFGLVGFSGLTCGVGLALWEMKIDYSWVPYGELGSVHRLSLTWQMDSSSESDYAKNKVKADSMKRKATRKLLTVEKKLSLPSSTTELTSAAQASLPLIVTTPAAINPEAIPRKADQAASASGAGETEKPILAIPMAVTISTESVSQTAGTKMESEPLNRETLTRINNSTGRRTGRVVNRPTPIASEPPTPSPTQEPIRQGWTADYYNKAKNYMGKHQYQTAYTYCQEALRWNPDDEGLQQMMQEIKRNMSGAVK